MNDGEQYTSVIGKAVWPLLFLTAILHAYFGLSDVAYLFMNLESPASQQHRWMEAATGALQAAGAIVAFVLSVRGDLRGATLAVAGCIMLGWLSLAPSVAEKGLAFHSNERIASIYFVLAPFIAIAGALMAWRNRYPTAAALLVTATTALGIIFVIAFGIIIAVHGF